MKKFVIITILLTIFNQIAFAENLFDNIFSEEKIEVNTENNINKNETNNKEEENEELLDEDLRESKEFKTSEERSLNNNTDPDVFREKHSYNEEENNEDVLPSWVKTRKSSQTELYIVCKMNNGDFKAINILNKNGYIYPEYQKNDRNNYYTYFDNAKHVYVGDGVYELVKECDFSVLD